MDECGQPVSVNSAPELVWLKAEDLEIALAPTLAGGIAALTWRGIDILRPADDQTLRSRNPLGLASFPLVPFSGRIAAGRFEFGGRVVTLSPTNQGHAIHGQGWQGIWQCNVQSAHAAKLSFDHLAGEWPWAYRAEQSFELRQNRLTQTLRIENLADTPMPAGLGVHPYFPRTADIQLRARIDGYFPNDAAMLPTMRTIKPTVWDWTDGKLVNPPIDHQFTGWNGHAEIWWPSRGVHLAMSTQPPMSYLVVYAPSDHDFVCVEPVSHANNALNRSPDGAQDGIKVLAPGQQMAICVTLEINPLNSGE